MDINRWKLDRINFSMSEKNIHYHGHCLFFVEYTIYISAFSMALQFIFAFALFVDIFLVKLGEMYEMRHSDELNWILDDLPYNARLNITYQFDDMRQ